MFVHWIFLVSSVTLVSSKGIPGRIVGGHTVSIQSVPWQASLLKFGRHWCGAAIYSEDLVITAAHCVRNSFPGIYSVRVGSTFTTVGGQVVRVSQILAHEDFGPSFSNDIAVLQLRTSLKLGSSVRSIPLADSTPKAGSSASVFGWGAIGHEKPTSQSLLEVEVDIVDKQRCLGSYGQVLTKDMICAAAPGKDACSGDSGGPLVSNGSLVGIVSFGMKCAHPDYPGVYADVAQLKPWILGAVQRLQSRKN
ncbi:trypsin alpha-like [Drosophila ficusphila]|uniref:trypsin alpha-like n=1 Tax=Drosophila ficusphila TaxID=30025 RepID=UPI0007E637BC|nr:trypsin alpha-like [Drosophila ficusphila]